MNQDLRLRLQDLEKEYDILKQQRADNWREIQRLKEVNDLRAKEAIDKDEKLKALDYDMSRTSGRIDDLQKQIDARNYDLRNKQMILEDTHKEIQRLRDINGRVAQDNAILRKENDQTLQEAYDLRKENEFQGSRNVDVATQIRD